MVGSFVASLVRLFINSNETGAAFFTNTFNKTKQLIAVSAVATGIPYFIQLKKSILCPEFSNIPAAIAFGGVPIMVPIPPTVAAIDIPNSKALLKPDLPTEATRGITAATTMAAVAVFDISMDAIMVVNITAIKIFLGLVPESNSVALKSC